MSIIADMFVGLVTKGGVNSSNDSRYVEDQVTKNFERMMSSEAINAHTIGTNTTQSTVKTQECPGLTLL